MYHPKTGRGQNQVFRRELYSAAVELIEAGENLIWHDDLVHHLYEGKVVPHVVYEEAKAALPYVNKRLRNDGEYQTTLVSENLREHLINGGVPEEESARKTCIAGCGSKGGFHKSSGLLIVDEKASGWAIALYDESQRYHEHKFARGIGSQINNLLRAKEDGIITPAAIHGHKAQIKKAVQPRALSRIYKVEFDIESRRKRLPAR